MKGHCSINAQDAGLNLMNDYKIPSVEEIKLQNNGNTKFEVISLFAGGGGSSTGYRMAGGRVLAINEFIPEAINTYKANWQDTIIIDKDIRLITAEQILNEVGKKEGELDILDGSPPCSAFSTAGKISKNWGKEKKYSDTNQKNVEDLFYEYMRILRGIRPKIFIAENVRGLAIGKSKGYLNEIIRGLRDSGYNVECKLLDAKWLGIPQQRARIIFIGVRSDLWKENYNGKLHPKPYPYTITAKQAFHGLEMTIQDKIDTDCTKYATNKLLKTLLIGQQHKIRFSLFKLHPEKPSPCIMATAAKGSASVMHWENRGLTISEVKRLMSVPDDYVITGTYKQKRERLGRMVAPFMMKAIAENICNLGLFNENTA